MYSFADRTQRIASAELLSLDGYETNLRKSLSQIREHFSDKVFGSVIVISDGLFNTGGNPLIAAKTFDCPFLTIPIGDTIQRQDVVIGNVFYNEKAVTHAVNVVKAEIRAWEFPEERIRVRLMRETVPIAERIASGVESEISFEVQEDEPATIHYSLVAESLPGEITYENNREDFLIDYFENKVNILYISSGPGYDNALLVDVLRRIKNYGVTIRTQKSSSDFYEGNIDYKSFNELSAIILRGFPSTATSSELISSIAAKVREFNIPLIFLAGKETDYSKLDKFGDLIPFTVEAPAGEQSVSLQNASNQGPIPAGIYSEISSAPPVLRNVSSVVQKPETEVLMIDKISREPMLIARSSGRQKAAAFMGYGLWKWRLNSKKSYKSTLEKFVLELINMSLSKERKLKIEVIPKRKVFDYGEDAIFSAEVYDNNFNLVRNATVKAKIVSGQKVIKDGLVFSPQENKYSLNAGRLVTGDYRIIAEAEVDGAFYARDEVRFLSDTTRLEFKVTKSNFENLRLLSGNTGGRLFAEGVLVDSIDNLTKSIKEKEKMEIFRYANFNLWENKYLLITAIVLFALEWVLRKRNNLP